MVDAVEKKWAFLSVITFDWIVEWGQSRLPAALV
jgi:hypothetical protein